MPHRAFIGIGSNLGDRAENYRDAIQRIATIPNSRVVRQSSIYETEPVGDELMLKWPFLNGVVELETDLTPEDIMKRLLTIERAMGRKPYKGRKPLRGKYKPRIIDLDLLFFDKEVINSRLLTIPHPRLHERRFVLAPLTEIAPRWQHPGLAMTARGLLLRLPRGQPIRALGD